MAYRGPETLGVPAAEDGFDQEAEAASEQPKGTGL